MAIKLKLSEATTEKITKQELLKLLRSLVIRLIVVIIYNAVAAFIMVEIEASQNTIIKTTYLFKNTTNVLEFLDSTKEKLTFNITATDLRKIAYEILNFTERESQKINDVTMEPYEERYTTWLYFSFVSVMTIGYGDVTPKTNHGKIFLIFFATIGIPLMLWLLTLCGQLQTIFHCKVVCVICRVIAKIRKTRNSSICNTKILAVGVAFLYIILVGALAVHLIHESSNWSYLDSTYYWFCTVTTIGFGDLSIRPHAVQKIILWLIVKVLGLAMMAGLINSIFYWLQETKFKRATSKEMSRALGRAKSYELGMENNHHAGKEFPKEKITGGTQVTFKQLAIE